MYRDFPVISRCRTVLTRKTAWMSRHGTNRNVWTKAVVGDLVALQAVQPKVAMMPHQAWGCRRVDQVGCGEQVELEAVGEASSHSYWFASSGTG